MWVHSVLPRSKSKQRIVLPLNVSTLLLVKRFTSYSIARPPKIWKSQIDSPLFSL
jgi:hypothetical protein